MEQSSGNGLNRRTFLGVMGSSALATALVGCQKPVEMAIPYLNKPEEIIPGVANWYASTCGACPAACGLMVKTREGRPVKVEGNSLDVRTGGGLCAVGQASIWSLYDPERTQGPAINGTPAAWNACDRAVKSQLVASITAGKQICLVTSGCAGPTVNRAVNEFLSTYKESRHIHYEAVSHAAVAEAYRSAFGQPVAPEFHFDRAQRIISFDADFLGAWISPVAFTRQYAAARKPGAGAMTRHMQFESRMSLTGGNADTRICVAPSEQGACLLWLARQVVALAERDGVTLNERFPNDMAPPPDDANLRKLLDDLAVDVWAHRGRTLIVCGINDIGMQLTAVYLNQLLGSHGNTISVTSPGAGRVQRDADMEELVDAMHAGDVGALIVWGANPAYHYRDAGAFTEGLKQVDLTVSLNCWSDETTALMQYHCPDHHFLEAWGDAETRPGHYTLQQPAIRPIFNTRHGAESLLTWCGHEANMYEYLQTTWRESIFPRYSARGAFQQFWDQSLHDGICMLPTPDAEIAAETGRVAGNCLNAYRRLGAGSQTPTIPDNDLELEVYESVALRDGSHAHVPWLQELPDPITKTTWDNVALLAPATAEKFGIREGDIIRVSSSTASVEIPVCIQKGQHERTLSMALGYGRTRAGKAGTGVGVNTWPMATCQAGTWRYSGIPVKLAPTGRYIALAKTQTHDLTEGRPLVHEMSPDDVRKGHGPGGHHRHHTQSLWEAHTHEKHRWGMALDLNACTGCSACVISCQAENNIPTVGREEVRQRREMHWLRIDRYYAGPENAPRVLFQPMMCAHCDNAPCETVCPVLATVHDHEGLNVQVYNRCIGTRYCENNCPFKTRRFNWFEYERPHALHNLLLNPDVTVRSRGVMEKCTFCIQRIQEKRIAARDAGRTVGDGEIQTACQQSCPAGAIVFGDLNDPEGRVAQMRENPRSYRLLTELNIEPAVGYLARVRNGVS